MTYTVFIFILDSDDGPGKDKNLLFRGRREFPLQPLNFPI